MSQANIEQYLTDKDQEKDISATGTSMYEDISPDRGDLSDTDNTDLLMPMQKPPKDPGIPWGDWCYCFKTPQVE